MFTQNHELSLYLYRTFPPADANMQRAALRKSTSDEHAGALGLLSCSVTVHLSIAETGVSDSFCNCLHSDLHQLRSLVNGADILHKHNLHG